ncbi:MAG: nicotinate-nucleotide--dimethylbenzimidazole phosphoribosyltransferase [Candidatus Coatesbacteria bacterium]
MSLLEDTIARIKSPDRAAMARARARLDSLTKPPGSLGRLEELVERIAGITGSERPSLPRKAVIVMAGDHGVAAEGVSAYPPAVTPQMVINFLAGGAAINVLARRAGARVIVVDMGVAEALAPHPSLVSRRIGPGTANIARGPAMSRADAVRALEAGIGIVEEEIARGLDLVATGDMGIANTTPSTAIAAVLTGLPVDRLAGRGTGVDDQGLARKIAAVTRALEVNRPDRADGVGLLAKVGGFEIGGLAGVMLGAAARRVPVVIDGFISGAAALVAAAIAPAVKDSLIAAHVSAEPGHRLMLEFLGLKPVLSLELRLGEGTGAALVMPLIDAALDVMDGMATFGEAGVSGRMES